MSRIGVILRMTENRSSTRRALAYACANAVYPVIALVVLWACVQKEPISLAVSHRVALVLSLVGAALVVAFALIGRGSPFAPWPWRRRGQPAPGMIQKAAFTVLICTCIVSSFNYYKFNKTMLMAVNDYMDVTYYYTNSKFFNELGHFDLYDAILVSDEEGANRLKRINRIRDLRTYEHVSRKKALTPERRREIKSHFTPERWQEFRHDVDFLTRNYHNWDYLMTDRGYNPPATWTGVGGILSRAVPIEQMKIITMADFALVFVMFIVVGRAFGMSTMLFALLWYTTTFSGRWPILGQALLRFDWVATLVMGVCMLKMNRRAWAGGLMTYAMLSRVFPVLFFFPYLVIMVRDFIRHRRVAREHVHFIVGAALVFCVMVGLALFQLGPQSFAETADNLGIHAQSYSAHRVGLGVVMAYRGETSGSDLSKTGGLEAKRRRINSMKPYYYTLALLLMGVSAWYILRTNASAHRAIYLSIIPFYIIFVMQTNYYNVRLVPVVTHAADLSRYRNRVCLVLLFLVETVTQWMMTKGAGRFFVTTAMSYALLPYFLFIIAFMGYDIIASYRRGASGHREAEAVRAGT